MFSLNSKIDHATHTRLLDKLGAFLLTHNLTIDSRKLLPGDIFAAYPGTIVDGRKFISQVIEMGAKFIIWEAGITPDCMNTENLAVKDLAQYIGLLAAYKYNNPTEKYNTIGVTGTNGKTSITHWLNQAYSLLGNVTAIIGTTGAGVYPNITDYKMTTPDPITLQKLLASFVGAKVQVLAMEVSSHALHQGRVNGVTFDFAVWTNLTQDHLDYHETMEDYYLAKRDLFYWDKLKYAVINIDDQYGNRLYQEIKSSRPQVKCLSYGINRGDLQAQDIKFSIKGTSFKLFYLGESHEVNVKLIGNFNVYNILAVAGVLLLDGYPLNDIIAVLAKLNSVPGRMEAIIQPNKPLVVVDYAHTPDALENVLKALNAIEHSGKIYCVFGCGGDRDVKKRPIMGDIATQMSDLAIITTDNPRNEEPEHIITQIISGVTKQNFIQVTDREQAIQKAIELANIDDIILIAGKGHEIYQEICGQREHFSDVEVAIKYLKDIR